MAAQTLTTAEVAEELGTDQKRLRKFLRSNSSPIEPVGQGNRYSITRGQMKTLKKAFDAWTESHTRTVKEAA